MKKKNYTPLYSLMLSMYWMGFSTVMGFISVYLINCGASSGEIGIVIAVSGIISALLQPTVAAYIDKSEKAILKKTITLISFVMLFAGVSLFFCSGNKLGNMLCYGIVICLLQLLTPLLNALGIGRINAGEKLNIGFSRACSSAACAVASFTMGALVDRFGNPVIPTFMCLVFGLMLLFVWRFPDAKPALSAEKNTNAGVFRFFGKYPRYTGILCGCVLLFVSHILLNNFIYQIVVEKGGGSSEMGISMAIAQILEIAPALFFSYLLTRAKPVFWFRWTGAFFALKALGTLLCTGIPTFYAVQFLNIGGWPILSVSSVFFVNQIMEPGDRVKGQAYYTMTYTVGSVIGALAGGQLIDVFSVQTMLVFATATAALGAGIILSFTAGKWGKKLRTADI